LLVPPKVGAGWLVDAEGCAVVVGVFAPPRLNRLGAPLVAVLAPDVAGAELPPPMPENSDEVGAVVVAVPLPDVVVVAPLVAVILPGAEAAGAAPNNEVLPVVPADLDEAPPKRLGVAVPEDAGAALFPPRLNPAMLDGGCEDAEAAGVPPKANVGALLAGVALG